MRTLALLSALAVTTSSALADTTGGTVIAYDRVANVLVLDDKSVWSLETLATPPQGLKAGDTVEIDFTSNGDNGWGKINSVTLRK